MANIQVKQMIDESQFVAKEFLKEQREISKKHLDHAKEFITEQKRSSVKNIEQTKQLLKEQHEKAVDISKKNIEQTKQVLKEQQEKAKLFLKEQQEKLNYEMIILNNKKKNKSNNQSSEAENLSRGNSSGEISDDASICFEFLSDESDRLNMQHVDEYFKEVNGILQLPPLSPEEWYYEGEGEGEGHIDMEAFQNMISKKNKTNNDDGDADDDDLSVATIIAVVSDNSENNSNHGSDTEDKDGHEEGSTSGNNKTEGKNAQSIRQLFFVKRNSSQNSIQQLLFKNNLSDKIMEDLRRLCRNVKTTI